MDTWKPQQLQKMRVGGNAKFRAFLETYGLQDAPIERKYHTRAAEYYRDTVRATADGQASPGPPPSQEDGAQATGGTSAHVVTSGMGNDSGSRGFGSNGSSPGGFGSIEPNRADDGLDVGVLKDGLKSAAGAGMQWAGWFGTQTVGLAKRASTAAQDAGIVEGLKDGATWVAHTTGEAVNKVSDEQFIAQQKQRLSTVTQTVVQNSTDWFGNLKNNRKDADAFGGLQNMSTGNMQGFGNSASSPAADPAGQVSAEQVSAAPAAKPKKDIWDDDDWGKWD